jgi:hypothetical protein
MSDVKRHRNGQIQSRKALCRLLTAPEMFLRLTMWYSPLFFACSYLFFAMCLIRTGGKPVQAFRQVLSITAP